MDAYFSRAQGSTSLRGSRIDLNVNTEVTSEAGTERVYLTFETTLRGPLTEPRIGIGINDALGNRIATIFSETAQRLSPLAKGEEMHLRLITGPTTLMPGVAVLKIALADRGEDVEVHEDAIQFVIPEYRAFQTTPSSKPRGVMLLPLQVLELTHETSNQVSA